MNEPNRGWKKPKVSRLHLPGRGAAPQPELGCQSSLGKGRLWQASVCRGLRVRSKHEDKKDSVTYCDCCPQAQKSPLNLLRAPFSPLFLGDPGVSLRLGGSLGEEQPPFAGRLQAGLGSPLWPALCCSLAPGWGCPGAPRPFSSLEVEQRAGPNLAGSLFPSPREHGRLVPSHLQPGKRRGCRLAG